MKSKIIFIFLMIFIFTSQSCSESAQNDNNLLIGKFALEGICFNHVFTIEEGDFNTGLVSDWTHPETSEVYKNAFTIKNICDLPENLKEGDFFNFTVLKNRSASDCLVCLAYSPTPSNGLHVEFID